MHFHYAGFAATLLAALAIVALQGDGRLERFASAADLLVVAGVPVTAAGIATGSPALTIIGPIFLATGVLGIAALTAFWALVHGDLNAIGFSLAGLLGWTAVCSDRKATVSAPVSEGWATG